MARGVRLNRGGVGWCVLALLALLAPALLIAAASGLAAQPALDWQPALAASQPWRLWSAAWVHFSPAHLAANAAGALLVAALGLAARLPWRATLAWALAWPLTHLLLGLRPRIEHYGGLSGVLHAGVAIGAVWLVRTAAGRPRVIGIALLLGLVAKCALEEPWRETLPFSQALGIATVPWAHTAGAIAGTLAALLCSARRRR